MKFTLTRWSLLFGLLLAFACRSFGDQAWPAFRGPDRDGTAEAADPPVEWSAEKNVRWRAELPGEGWSSPVIGDGRIYLTAAIPANQTEPVNEIASVNESESEDDLDLCLLILDQATGKLLDTVVVMHQSSDQTPRIHSKNTHSSPTPILDGDRIYVHFGYQGTACLTRTGKRVWLNRELSFKPVHGNGGSPVLADGKLVFTCDGSKQPRVVALDADTGNVVWQTARPVDARKKFSFCTPTVITVNGKKQIIAPGSDCVLALEPSSGSILWEVHYDGYSVIPKPLYHHGLVFISTSFDSSKMLAIHPDGQGLVTDSHVEWRLDRNIPKTPSMIAYQDHVYSVSDDGIFLCVDAASGEIVYRERLGGNYSASPIRIGDRIYVTDEQGVTHVVRGGVEAFERIAENDLGERTLASPAVSGNAIFIRTAEALYRLENGASNKVR